MSWKAVISAKRAGLDGAASAELRLMISQGAQVATERGDMINMSSNNYLALADHPEIKAAAVDAINKYGFGLASVRFLSGTHAIHKQLEEQTAGIFSTEDAVLFGSCFDANAGVFEALLDANDRIVSDELNHASIIDGIRLCKAQRLRYKHRDVEDLGRQLSEPHPAGMTVIVTDGVFSMNGAIAPLREIVDLARKFGAFVMVDDSHGIGTVGKTGRGVVEEQGLLGQIDLITGTYGKALGGGMGGFAASSSDIATILRRRARPYLFSNPVPPHIAAGVGKALDIMLREPERVARLGDQARYLRNALTDRKIEVLEGQHPIVPVMLRSTESTRSLVSHCRSNGILVSAIVFPIVAKGQERVRLQVSAGHTFQQLDSVVGTIGEWWSKNKAAGVA